MAETTPSTPVTAEILSPLPKPTVPVIPAPAFLLPSEAASSLAGLLSLPLPSLLPLLVPPAAAALPRAPISRFPVAAAALGSSGRVFLGVNLEFPGVPLHHSVHAEQFLVAHAALHAEPRLLFLAVSHFPCGHCRQFLQELRRPDDPHDLQILVTSDPNPSFRPLSSLLPFPFGPRDLLPDHAPLLLDLSRRHPLLLLDHPDPTDRELADAALEAAKRSHAPYSNCPAGFAVADEDGKVYSGGPYMESAAYNPSLGPVQAGLIAYVAAGGGEYSRIARAVLVEMEDAAVSHAATARALLERTAPRCELQVYRSRTSEEDCLSVEST